MFARSSRVLWRNHLFRMIDCKADGPQGSNSSRHACRYNKDVIPGSSKFRYGDKIRSYEDHNRSWRHHIIGADSADISSPQDTSVYEGMIQARYSGFFILDPNASGLE